MPDPRYTAWMGGAAYKSFSADFNLTVPGYAFWNMSATTTGLAITLIADKSIQKGWPVVTVYNGGSNSFDVGGLTVAAGEAAIFGYDGSAFKGVVRASVQVGSPSLPDPVGAIVGGIGGQNTRSLIGFDPGTSTWVQKADAPFGVARYGGATGVGNSIYLQGGSGLSVGTTAYRGNAEYLIFSNTWFLKTEIPENFEATSVESDGTDTFLFGNINGSVTPFGTKARKYDVSADTWSVIATQTHQHLRGSATRDTGTGEIFLVGGHTITGQTYSAGLTRVDKYDPSGDTWANVTNTPASGVQGHAAGYQGRKLYLAGGYRGNISAVAGSGPYNPVTDTLEFDMDAETAWVTKTAMTAARSQHACIGALASGKLVYAGGSGPGTYGNADAYTYDPSANTWATIASLPMTKYGVSDLGTHVATS